MNNSGFVMRMRLEIMLKLRLIFGKMDSNSQIF